MPEIEIRRRSSRPLDLQRNSSKVNSGHQPTPRTRSTAKNIGSLAGDLGHEYTISLAPVNEHLAAKSNFIVGSNNKQINYSGQQADALSNFENISQRPPASIAMKLPRSMSNSQSAHGHAAFKKLTHHNLITKHGAERWNKIAGYAIHELMSVRKGCYFSAGVKDKQERQQIREAVMFYCCENDLDAALQLKSKLVEQAINRVLPKDIIAALISGRYDHHLPKDFMQSSNENLCLGRLVSEANVRDKSLNARSFFKKRLGKRLFTIVQFVLALQLVWAREGNMYGARYVQTQEVIFYPRTSGGRAGSPATN